MESSWRDRGQAAIAVVVVTATLFVVVMAALVTVGTRVVDRGRAQTAADAAALASLNGGRAAAVDLARRHGGTVVSWERGPSSDQVTVVVTVGRARATAAATDAP
jgi:hypothetical protein